MPKPHPGGLLRHCRNMHRCRWAQSQQALAIGPRFTCSRLPSRVRQAIEPTAPAAPEMKITSPGRSLIASARPIYAVWPVCPHTPRYIWGELTSTSGFCKAAAGAAHENGVQSQKENIHYHALLYVRPTRKRLMAREETNPTSCLEEAPKPPRFLEFPSSGGANIDTNHMLLVHDIGQLKAGRVTLFHHDIVPSCASARENSPRRGTAGKGFSVCVPERNTVRVLHCNSYLIEKVKSINVKV
jgi:hypothetical protein